MTHDASAIRASDAERDQAVERLRTHAVDGRLTLEEFADRVERAYAARTVDDLNELSSDLPETTPAPAPRRPTQRRRFP